MKKVLFPIPIDPFYKIAKKDVDELLRTKKIEVDTIILDDWNSETGRDVAGPRLIYGEPFANDCNNQCEDCTLCWAIGMDMFTAANQCVGIRTTLCLASIEQRKIFPSKQRCLNCKTLEQYQAAYVAFFLQKCGGRRFEVTQQKLLAELLWVAGFRIIRHNRIDKPEYLKRLERDTKHDIVVAVANGFREQSKMQEAGFVERVAGSFGLR